MFNTFLSKCIVIERKFMKFLKYLYYRIMYNFVCKSKKEYYKSMKTKYKVILFSTSKINVQGKDNEFDIFKIKQYNINLTIVGCHNQVIIGDNCRFYGCCNIVVYGDNNKVVIGDNCYINNASPVAFLIGHINLSPKTNSVYISVGENTYIGGIAIIAMENNSKVIIGKKCLISSSIEIFATDTHSLLDMNGGLINYGGEVVIGDNCWLGKGVKITKKAFVPSNTVVGMYSIVTSKFDEENTVIAGNPAKIVKRGVKFDWLSPNVYLEKHPEAIV